MSRLSLSWPFLSWIGSIIDLILSKKLDFDFNFDFDDMTAPLTFET